MPDQRSEELELLKQQIEQGARWFYWIIGLSLVNAVLVMAGENWHFIIGSSLIDAGAIALAAAGMFSKTCGIIMLVLAVGTYLILGRKAHKASKWAFIIGMGIYLFDGIIYFIFEDYLSGLFHFYVLYKMYGGLKAIAPYRTLQMDIEINAIVVDKAPALSTEIHTDYMPPAEPTASEAVSE